MFHCIACLCWCAVKNLLTHSMVSMTGDSRPQQRTGCQETSWDGPEFFTCEHIQLQNTGYGWLFLCVPVLSISNTDRRESHNHIGLDNTCCGSCRSMATDITLDCTYCTTILVFVILASNDISHHTFTACFSCTTIQLDRHTLWSGARC